MDYLETIAERLIAITRRSQWKQEILADAEQFRSEGYVSDVALAMAVRYWEGNPVTEEIPPLNQERNNAINHPTTEN